MFRRPEVSGAEDNEKERGEKKTFFRGAPSTPKEMSTTTTPPSGGGVHFAIPEGTASITQANPGTGEGHDSWREWGVDKEEVTSVTIPTSMISIGEFAFGGCSALASVTIPMSVTSIGHNAFGGCS